MKNFLEKLKNNFHFILLFFITLILLTLHHFSYSWDLIVFLENAKYLLGEGNYFELLRPPFISIIFLILLIIFPDFLVTYIYIILMSFLFFYIIKLLSKELKINFIFFYLLFFTPYFYSFFIFNGSEILNLILILFFIYFILKNNFISGFFLGLAFLTRYSSLNYIIFLFLLKNKKNIFISLILFSIPISMWFIFNYFFNGNFFSSIANQYSQVILFRDYIIQKINYSQIFTFFNFYIVFFIFGVSIFFYDFFIKNKNSFMKKVFENKFQIFCIIIFIETFRGYYNVPLKEVRYLFLLMLPLTYFTYYFFNFLIKKNQKIFNKYKKFFYGIFIIFICFNFTFYLGDINKENKLKDDVIQISNFLKENNLSKCQTDSNIWILLIDKGINSDKKTFEKSFEEDYESGINFVIYKNIEGFSSIKKNFSKYNVIKNSQNYLILGNQKCVLENFSQETYLEKISKKVTYPDEKIIYTPCNTLFKNTNLQNLCEIVNFNFSSLSFKK